MANAAAFDLGYATGQGIAQDQRARKQAREDQAHDVMVDEKHGLIDALQKKIPTLKKTDENGNSVDTPESLAAMNQLTQLTLERNELLNPSKHPGALQRFAQRIGIGPKTQTPVVPQRISSTPVIPAVASSSVDLGSSSPAFPASAPVTIAGPKGQTATTTPKDVSVPQSSSPVALPAQPAAKGTPSVGPSPLPGQYAKGTPAELRERAKRIQAATAEAGQIAAAAPESPQAAANRELQANYARIDASSLSPEDKAEAKRRLFSLTARPDLKLFTLPNGETKYLDASRPDLIPEGATAYVKPTIANEELAEYNKYIADGGTDSIDTWKSKQRISPSVFNEYADAYAKAHGTTRDKLSPDSLDYIKRTLALDNAISTSTTTTSPKEDAEGFWREIQATNTRTPGGGSRPSDPLGPIQAAPTAPSATPKTPAEVKREANKRAPKPSSSPATTSGTTTVGNVKIGPPLFAGKNKEYDDANTAYDGAVSRTKSMERSLKHALQGDQQAMLSLVANHIGMTLGAQKGARINQAVWKEAVASAPWLASAEAKFDSRGFLSGVTLTPEQMKQMVNLAHDNTEVAKENVETIRKRLNLPSDSGSGASRHKIKIGNKIYIYNGTGDTADLNNYTEVKE